MKATSASGLTNGSIGIPGISKDISTYRQRHVTSLRHNLGLSDNFALMANIGHLVPPAVDVAGIYSKTSLERFATPISCFHDAVPYLRNPFQRQDAQLVLYRHRVTLESL